MLCERCPKPKPTLDNELVVYKTKPNKLIRYA